MASLYEECLELLGEQAKVMTEEDTVKIFDVLQESVQFTSYGRISWDTIEQGEDFTDQIKISLPDGRVYIMWDNALFPAIESSFSITMRVLESVKKVSFDTWIFSPNEYVIEFYHEGESKIAYLK